MDHLCMLAAVVSLKAPDWCSLQMALDFQGELVLARLQIQG